MDLSAELGLHGGRTSIALLEIAFNFLFAARFAWLAAG